jgi:hypothetical protein
MKPNSKKQTANLRLSALILKTVREETDVNFPPRIQLGKARHQRRLAEISGSKCVFSLKATFRQPRFSKKGSK